MYEGEPDDDDEEEQPPVSFTRFGDDGGLRSDWLETAEFIAATERHFAMRAHNPAIPACPMRDGHDHLEPAFVLLGGQASLAFVGEATTGIIERGEAFAAWVRDVGESPDATQRFDESYLGRWESVEAFAKHMLETSRPTDDDSQDGTDVPRRAERPDPAKLAAELQRRGAIRAIPSPQGGVWLFRQAWERSPQTRPDTPERR